MNAPGSRGPSVVSSEDEVEQIVGDRGNQACPAVEGEAFGVEAEALREHTKESAADDKGEQRSEEAGAILACLGLASRAPPPAAPRPDEVLADSLAEIDQPSASDNARGAAPAGPSLS
jgi:hypothetical protein